MAREDWQWDPEYNLKTTTHMMLELVSEKLKAMHGIDDTPKVAAMQ
jgi:hypothetical protein